jgi:hypothetical protein
LVVAIAITVVLAAVCRPCDYESIAVLLAAVRMMPAASKGRMDEQQAGSQTG